MINDKIKEDYIKIINEDYKDYRKDYQNLLEKRKEYGATYKDL